MSPLQFSEKEFKDWSKRLDRIKSKARAKQTAEGHQRGRPIPKSESARKGTGKVKAPKRTKR